MYNVIFHEKTKEITKELKSYEYVLNEETGEKELAEVTTTETVVYRIPSKYVFNTVTNCDHFLFNNKIVDDFIGDAPSLNSAVSMFEGSAITTVANEAGEAANFSSVTSGNYMFRNCSKLQTVNIDLSSLVNVEDLFEGCSALVAFRGSLSSLIDATEMFIDSTSLTIFNANLDNLRTATSMFKGTSLNSFQGELPQLENGESMFERTLIIVPVNTPKIINANRIYASCHNITNINVTWPNAITADECFVNNSKLEYCYLNAQYLTSANNAFERDINLLSFTGNLQHLTKANAMFKDCSSLKIVTIPELNELEEGKEMFKNTKISFWDVSLSSLKNGPYMFAQDTAAELLTEFNGDLSSLENGDNMFAGQTGLRKFISQLSSLISGVNMFSGCKLDATSVLYILETLPFYGDNRSITIGIGAADSSSSLNDFAINTGVYSSWEELNSIIADRGWTVTWEYNG